LFIIVFTIKEFPPPPISSPSRRERENIEKEWKNIGKKKSSNTKIKKELVLIINNLVKLYTYMITINKKLAK